MRRVSFLILSLCALETAFWLTTATSAEPVQGYTKDLADRWVSKIHVSDFGDEPESAQPSVPEDLTPEHCIFEKKNEACRSPGLPQPGIKRRVVQPSHRMHEVPESDETPPKKPRKGSNDPKTETKRAPAFVHVGALLIVLLVLHAFAVRLSDAEHGFARIIGLLVTLVRPVLVLHRKIAGLFFDFVLLALFASALQHLGECSQQDACILASLDGGAALACLVSIAALLQLHGGSWVQCALGFKEHGADPPLKHAVGVSVSKKAAPLLDAPCEVVVRVPGKLILFGEHAVCFGQPAIASTISHSLEITAVMDPTLQESVLPVDGELLQRAWAALPPPPRPVRLSIVSDIPRGCGLGSSSALLAGLAALSLSWEGKEKEKTNIFQLAWDLEKRLCYPSCSGVDIAAVVFGGTILYQEGKVLHQFDRHVPRRLHLVDVGSTHSCGDICRDLHSASSNTEVWKDIGQLVRDAIPHVEAWSEQHLAALAEKNHTLLLRAGVPWPSISLPQGKLTGAGGGGYAIQFGDELASGTAKSSVEAAVMGVGNGVSIVHNGKPPRLVTICKAIMHQCDQCTLQLERAEGQASAPSNIALLKYWGKEAGRCQMPENPSLSLTLGGLRTTTTVTRAESGSDGEYPDDRARRFVDTLLRETTGETFSVKVATHNSFPTGCGIASSASGFSALVEALADLLGLDTILSSDDLAFWKESWARLGSGSAIRSLYGGFVGWEDDRAVRIADPTAWSQTLHHIVVVLDGRPKAISSSAGHRGAHSSLFHGVRVAGTHRALDRLKSAIKARSWPDMIAVVEADALLMHSVMCTSTPPSCYPTKDTMALVAHFVRERDARGLQACWTLDAGPNPHFIMAREDAPAVRAILSSYGGELIEGCDCRGPHVGKGVLEPVVATAPSPELALPQKAQNQVLAHVPPPISWETIASTMPNTMSSPLGCTAPVRAAELPTNLGTVVVKGVSAGLPGPRLASSGMVGSGMVFKDALKKLLQGTSCVCALSPSVIASCLEKHVVHAQKLPEGVQYNHVRAPEDTIQLAAQVAAHEVDLSIYGVKPSVAATMDPATRVALVAGLEALRDAGICTGEGETGWRLPEHMQATTGVVFASSFPALDSAVAEVSRFFRTCLRNADLAHAPPQTLLEELRRRLPAATEEHQMVLQHLEEQVHASQWVTDAEEYTFDSKLLFRLLVLANAQLAQLIHARGPNMQTSAACAGTTQALSLAQDLLRSGRAKHVVVIAGDTASSDNLLPWIGNGFRALGAACTKNSIKDAALPFDKRRSGILIGGGAVGMVLSLEDDWICAPLPTAGASPVSCGLLATHCCNSAYHGVALDVDHIATELDGFLAKVEEECGISRAELARYGVYLSHETGTNSSPRSSCAFSEVSALRRSFGDDMKHLTIVSTKGFTGHAMGASFEDVVAVEVLRTGIAPPVPNWRVPDEVLGDLKLSRGGVLEPRPRYALRFAAGFGSQIAFALFGTVNMVV